MATHELTILWNDNSGYSVGSEPSEMAMNDTLNIFPPSGGCTVNFNPDLTQSGTSYSSYNFGGTMQPFTVPTQADDYDFIFSVPGKNGKSGIPDHTIPIKKT